MSAAYPRAVRQLGFASMQGRAARTGQVLAGRNGGEQAWARPPHRVVVRLWLPATALFWLLSPIPLVLAPLAWLAPARLRPANPYAAVLAIGRVLTSVGGTVVDVDTPDCLVRVRIF
jgi:hypothetical protein